MNANTIQIRPTLKSLAASSLLTEINQALRPLVRQCANLFREQDREVLKEFPWSVLHTLCEQFTYKGSKHIGTEPHSLESLAEREIQRELNRRLNPVVFRCKDLCLKEDGIYAQIWNQFDEGLITEDEFLMKLVDLLLT